MFLEKLHAVVMDRILFITTTITLVYVWMVNIMLQGTNKNQFNLHPIIS